MSWIMLACVLLAFSLTYFWPVASGTKSFIALRHLHGAVFFAWMGFYVWQSQLVAAGKTARHKNIGLLGLALSGALLPLGIWMMLTSTHERVAAGSADPYYFSFFSLVDMIAFGSLLVAAISTAMRRSDWHKRFMYAAALALVGPAISRWFLLVPAYPPWTDFGPSLLADLLFIPLVLHDRRTLGRIHPATLIAIVVVVPVHVAVPFIAASGWWAELAPRLLGG